MSDSVLQPGRPGFTFRRPVRLVSTQAGLEELCRELLAEEIIALDVETTLDWGTLCLAQVATGDYNAVIDVFELDDLTPLFLVLEDPSIGIIIHNARFEQSILGKLGCRITSVFDTLTISRRLRGYRIPGGHSLGAVCRRELAIELDKSYQTSDWSRRPLSNAQLNYAALDAEVLIDLHRNFQGEMD
ncbi:MAG: ribonuclease D [Candidatus Erginobacter occultus]|nr:ribonuclease D [Candidatus Erginobacter occultus]